ncbi:hypothetical protein ACIQAC_28075 [Streptomyces sp. NPDC088387]|uniref:hypothetical protein n=1 Tax=Streptomyces sp. NPDC088387 TaxID=3365859 RepID=UPI003805593D
MFRRLYDAVAGLLGRPRPVDDDRDLAGEVRTPDPYVWRLPDPYAARWRRWARRSRAAGYRLAFPRDEECWVCEPPAREPRWETSDDVVRAYVLRP